MAGLIAIAEARTHLVLCLESKSKQGTFAEHIAPEEEALCLESKSKQGTLRCRTNEPP